MTRPPFDPLSRRDEGAALDGLMGQARKVGLDAEALVPTFERFLEILGRFAEIEVRVLGSVPLQFPAYMYEGGGGTPVDPLREADDLARRERERLDLDPGALDDPIELVESQGIKVVQLPFPADSALQGAFLFDAATGPAILLDASRPPREREYAAAHFYGHFLADYDPFRTWACRRIVGEEAPREEVRACAFASAFLAPPQDLALYLSGAGVRAGDALTGGVFRELRVYFNCDDRAILGSLLSSGRLTAERVAPLLEEAGPPAVGEGLPAAHKDVGVTAGALPGRFVGMAVAAHRTGALSLAELARTLEVDEAMALLIERSLTVMDDRRPDARRPA